MTLSPLAKNTRYAAFYLPTALLWNEYGDSVRQHGDLVFVIEYCRQDFDEGCKDSSNLSIVLRDRNLVGPGGQSYVYNEC